MFGKELVKTDKNGTKYWHVVCPCGKCDGKGRIDYYSWNCEGVCFRCNGSGTIEFNEKEYTPEYLAKMEERRIAKAKKNADATNKKWLVSEGFSEDGKVWLVIGDTYSIKDELKQNGAKFNYVLGWHFDHAVENYKTIELDAKNILKYSEATGEIWTYNADVIEDAIKNASTSSVSSSSDYVGEVGERIEEDLTLDKDITIKVDTKFAEFLSIYSFHDINGNVIVWKTATGNSDLVEGKQFKIRATIKEHGEYKGVKQTFVKNLRIL